MSISFKSYLDSKRKEQISLGDSLSGMRLCMYVYFVEML